MHCPCKKALDVRPQPQLTLSLCASGGLYYYHPVLSFSLSCTQFCLHKEFHKVPKLKFK